MAPVAEGGEVKGPVFLIVYAYDQCGGCGVDGPGCGDCKDIDRYHAIIKGQFGDRLYNSGIEYRMFNCRILAHGEALRERCAAYGVPDDMLYIRPMTLIGTEDAGLYLPGEDLLFYAGEMLDRYAAGENAAGIQSDIASIFAARESR